MKCKLCAGQKTLATACTSNANLLKHLTKVHGTIKLVAKDPTAASTSSDTDGPPPPKQAKCLNIYFVFIVPLHFIMIVATMIGGCLFSHCATEHNTKPF